MERISISLFQGYRDTNPTEVSIDTVVDMIRQHPAVIRHTERYRYYLARQQSKPAGFEKASCPCFAVAVRFKDGKQKSDICGLTGLCLADFDHIAEERMDECLAKLREDPHTFLAYTTISGQGIRVIARYEAADEAGAAQPFYLHVRAFKEINQHYAKLLHCPFDEKCKNITRLSGLAHDPHVYYCPEALPFRVETDKGTRQNGQPTRAAKKLAKAVEATEKWLEEQGIAYLPGHRNEYIMRMGYRLNAYGIPLSEATRWAKQRFTDYDGDVAGIFRSCYLQTEEHATLCVGGRERLPDNAGNTTVVQDIETFLSGQGRYRKNTVTGKCEMAPKGSDTYKDLTDRTVNTLWSRMCKEVRNIRLTDMRAVLESEFVSLYNPFVCYLESLPAWDGQTDHIAALAAQVHVKTGTALFPLFFRKWLVAMIASLLDAEVVNHEILVLIGRQGIYKTTWLNNLLPPELRRYFYLKSNSRNINKDDILTLSEFAIVCLEELDEMEGRDVNQLKALTTMRCVNERAAYAHFKEVRQHIASFCGTSNNIHFLTDLTGNRRWMPFEIESIDNPYEHPLDYAGIYAQAYALFKTGFHYWLEEEEIKQLATHNHYFEVPCLERELIQTYFQRPLDGQECSFLSNAQILMRINGGIRQKLSNVKIGLAMKQEGYEAVRSGGKRGYRVVELTAEEIALRKKAMARYC